MKYIYLILVITSCLAPPPDNFGRYELLEKPRILALVPDIPESSPGDIVTITPVLSDINGGGRPFTYTSEACLFIPSNSKSQESCGDSPLQFSLGEGNVTGLSSTDYTGAVNSISVLIPTLILTGRTEQDKFNGVNLRVYYKIKSEDGDEVNSFIDLLVSSKSTKNKNPTINSILFDGKSFTTMSDQDGDLSITPAKTSEDYLTLNSTGQKINTNEEITYTWFITDGNLESFRSGEEGKVRFSPPEEEPKDRNVLIIVFARDNRGGVSYSIKRL